MRLEFGFVDMPYAARYSQESPLTASTKKRQPKRVSAAQTAYGQGKTTGQVARELESRYKIVETFFDMEENYILPLVEDALVDNMIMELTTGHSDPKINQDLSNRIATRFRRDLSGRKFDGVIRGVPTLASIRGVSHLKKKPYGGGSSPRPSFIDTGMYQRSFQVEVKE